MRYLDLYYRLKEAFDTEKKGRYIAEDLGLQIDHYPFDSDQCKSIQNGKDKLYCEEHDLYFDNNEVCRNDYTSVLEICDAEIFSNRKFQFHVLSDVKNDVSRGVILFFHGLNEKNWDKYLPWAYGLMKKTGKAVVLFPIAFHMDRAPSLWSMRREMQKVAEKRMTLHADNTESSFVNAAISARLEAFPQRLFWSGFQTYADVIHLIGEIKKGHFSQIDRNTTIDLFGYSIGSFFSLILMMSDPKGYFSSSRLFCFCGGMTIDRMFPISKYIMDARAAIAMQESFAALLSSDFITDPRLSHYQDEKFHYEESWFKTMLRYNYFQKRREDRLRELEGRVKALTLKKDEVAPPTEALNTLQGGYRDIQIDIDIKNYPYEYTHMIPFPLTKKNADIITASYEEFIESASDFLF